MPFSTKTKHPRSDSANLEPSAPIFCPQILEPRYVGFFSYNAYEGPARPVCRTCTDGSTDPKCTKLNRSRVAGASRGGLGIHDTDPSYMSWSATATGSWSEPVMVLGPDLIMDGNLACVIHRNGSLVGMWRDHQPGGKHSTPHLVTASAWKDPSTYKYEHEDVIFGNTTGGNLGGIEDMFLWVDARGHYHSVFHCEGTRDGCCSKCTGHAFSRDGRAWHWGGTAATNEARYDDGSWDAKYGGP